MSFHISFSFLSKLKYKCFTFISELIEENVENKKKSEVEGKNHFRTGKKPLSCSQTQKDLKKEEPSNLSPALSVERDRQTNIILSFT